MNSRRRSLPRAFALLLLLPPGLGWGSSLASAQAVQEQQEPVRSATTIILVRHAEKAAVPGSDPPLSSAGEARSLALLDALRDAGVGAVIVTQLQRTRLTAALLTAHLGLVPEVVPAGGDVPEHARRVAATVLERHAGRTVLVVGHSNTIPAIVQALGGGEIPPIADDRYDDVYVVIRPVEGSVRRLTFRYGATS